VNHLQRLTVVPLSEWPQAAAVLAPALAMVPLPDADIRRHLERREFLCWRFEGSVTGYVITSVGPAKDGPKCLWAKYAAGRIEGGPRARIAALRWVTGALEALAEDEGCSEVRLEGRRAWRRAFPDYEITLDGKDTVHLRKVLTYAKQQ
jgi:hypothetical protein